MKKNPGAAAIAAAMMLSAGANAAGNSSATVRGGILADAYLPFVANAGQMDARVAFHARTFAGGVFALRTGDLVYSLPAPRSKSGAGDGKGWVLKESFVEGRAIPIAGERAQTHVSVLSPEGAYAHVAATAGVRFGEVWPGVAVEIHARGNNVEKVFTLAPGVEADAIRVQIDGASLSVARDGSLVATTGHGPVSFAAPFAYQERGSRREAVPVRYRAEGNRYGFELGAFDRSRALVIDPIIQSTYIGGSGSTFLQEGPTDIAVHPTNGDVYVSGATDSADLPGVAGGAVPALAGNTSGFIARFSADLQTLEQATFFGGQADEIIHSIVVTNNDVYVSGQSVAGALPAGTTAGAQPTDPNPGSDFNGFIARLPLSLTSVTASTFLGGTTNHPTQIFESALHGNGSLYVCGQTSSGSLPSTAGGFDAANGAANRSAFIARVAADLTAFEQITYFSDGGVLGGARTRCTALAVISGSGDIVAGGQTTFGSAAPPNTAGGLLTTTTGAWLARFNGALTQNSQSTWLAGTGSGTSEPSVAGLRIHPGNGDLYVLTDRVRAGSPLPSNATVGGGQDTCTGALTCLLVMRVSPTLTSLVAGTFYGNASAAAPIPRAHDHLTIDPTSGDVFIVSDGGPNLPNTAGGIQPAPLGGGTPGIMVRIRGDLAQIVQASYLSGDGTSGTSPRAAVVHPNGHLYVAGSTGSASFPQTSGGAQPAIGGPSGDGFVSRITLDLLGSASPGALQFSPAAYTTVEGNTVLQVSVTRSGGSDGAASVSYATSNGTASAGSDYTSASGTLNWASGDGAAKTISVPILADAAAESDETVNLTLTNATGATLGAQTTATITITDDDAAPAQPGVVQFSSATYTGNENGGSVTLTLTRTSGADGAISVSVASGGGSASAGADYSALSQTVNWADGDSATKTVALALLNDSADESDETVTVTLSNVTGGASLGTPASATVTIVDDDPTPQTQNDSARGSYGGGAMAWWLILALGALALWSRTRRVRAAVVSSRLLLCALTLLPKAEAADIAAGWYLGVRGGVAESTLDENEVDRALAARSHDVRADVDDRNSMAALFGGYRWTHGVGLEGSVVDLGEYDVTLTGTTSNPAQLLADAETVLADAGRGVSASVTWTWALSDRFEITPRLGAYYWKSERELRSSAARAQREEDGVDVTGGLSLAWRLTPNWSLGLGWEIWDAGDRNDIRAYTAAVSYRFGR